MTFQFVLPQSIEGRQRLFKVGGNLVDLEQRAFLVVQNYFALTTVQPQKEVVEELNVQF